MLFYSAGTIFSEGSQYSCSAKRDHPSSNAPQRTCGVYPHPNRPFHCVESELSNLPVSGYLVAQET